MRFSFVTLPTCLLRLVVFFLLPAGVFASQLVVSWDDNSTGETGFKIERSIDGVTFTALATVAADTTTFTDTTVVSGTSYSYRVCAYTATATSAYSNVAVGAVTLTSTMPAITTQPISQTVTAGSNVSLSVAASGVPTPAYQWYKSGVTILGATTNALSLTNVSGSDAASYTVVVSNSAGSVTSNPALITVNVPPAFTTQPSSQSAILGGSVSFTVAVTGSPQPALQWCKDGTAITGATSATLSLNNLTSANAGTYTVVATNVAGSVTSNGAVLTISGVAPAISTQPVSQSVMTGGNVSFVVAVSGTPTPTLQWRKNGVAITGATASTLSLFNVSSSDAATYSVVATNSAGSVTSANATLTVTALPTIPGRLASVSTQAVSAPWGSAALRLDFATTGGSKSILLRAIGPSLSSYTTAVVFSDPVLKIYDGSTVIATNDNWGGSATLSDTFLRVGAFPIAGTSKDSAILAALPSKTYSAVISGSTGGMALAEIYDADTTSTPVGRFASVSARGSVGTGTAALMTGFVITGDTPVRLLVRAIGPSLAGLQGVLKDPQLDIYRGTTLVQHNDNWGGTSALIALFQQVGASKLSSKSKDAALDITLPPGTYSAVVSGVSATTGLARIEFYPVQ